MIRKSSTAYVWFDTEFTSLELDEAQLLQVAVMLTDKDLKRITPPEEDLNFYIRLPENAPLSPWVQKNIPELIKKCRSRAAVPVEEVDAKLSVFIDRWCGTPTKTIQKRPLLAGNSIHTDWMLARKFFPAFTGRLHYRLMDVSALKIQWLDLTDGEEFKKDDPKTIKKYFPEADLRRLRQHDACFDIVASAAELAYYRAHMHLAT
ncbi:MAG: exonuclease domain-containing protein [Kiritimatiellales bacterium]|jgi:oligoribonuclease